MSRNKKLGTIQNNDVNCMLVSGSGKGLTPKEYGIVVGHLLDGGADVMAQDLGLPDPVIYRSNVATTWDKHLVEVTAATWPGEEQDVVTEQAVTQVEGILRLFEAGTDPLQLTIEACRQRGVAVVASYRMNAEDWYANTWRLSDFGRAHPDWRIPDAGCLDPAVPGVYEQRMAIFTEVAQEYDVDGIEFNFRRWCKMVSNPLKNHTVLTRMVRDTRRMLDETAAAKGRGRLLLGVRVGPSLADPPGTEYPGGDPRVDPSSRDLGLDVPTWVKEELVDYVCPSLFWPRLPGMPKTAEFVALVGGRNIGVYPSVFPLPAWGEDEISIPDMSPDEIRDMMKRHRAEICNAALQCYDDGADGISTFNWSHGALYSARTQREGTKMTAYRGSLPYMRTELFVHRFLGSPGELQECLGKEPIVSGRDCRWPD
jgi:hypothetical protein